MKQFMMDWFECAILFFVCGLILNWGFQWHWSIGKLMIQSIFVSVCFLAFSNRKKGFKE